MRIFALLFAALLPSMASAQLAADKAKTLGSPSAPIMIELYSDFMCPHCKHLHEDILPAMILDYVNSGKAYLIFREFPLAIPQHVYSRPAANFATAAARIGKYQAVSDVLFKNQVAWSANGKVWETVASVLTPDEQKKVQALANDPSVLAEVQRDYELGQRARINSTPTVVITYKLRQQPWSEWSSYPLFKSYVDDLLKK